MRTLYRVLSGFALGTVFTLNATGAEIYAPGGSKDVPYVVASPFAGFYFGVNGGGGFASNSDQLALPGSFSGVSPSGGFAGVQAGYNWAGFGFHRLVLGVEADVQVAAIEEEAKDAALDVFKSRLQFFSTVRGKIGYAMDRTLLYLTGGFAFGSVRNEASLSGLGADFLVNTTSTGYTAGGGIEYKLNSAWAVKGEYQYIDLGRNEPKDPAFGTYTANGGTVRNDAFHTVRLGLNFYMHRDPEPLK